VPTPATAGLASSYKALAKYTASAAEPLPSWVSDPSVRYKGTRLGGPKKLGASAVEVAGEPGPPRGRDAFVAPDGHLRIGANGIPLKFSGAATSGRRGPHAQLAPIAAPRAGQKLGVSAPVAPANTAAHVPAILPVLPPGVPSHLSNGWLSSCALVRALLGRSPPAATPSAIPPVGNSGSWSLDPPCLVGSRCRRRRDALVTT